MKNTVFSNLLGFVVLSAALTSTPAGVSAGELLHHDITVRFDPGERSLDVSDTVSLPAGPDSEGRRSLSFRLHEGLSPRLSGPGTLTMETGSPSGFSEGYAVTLPQGSSSFTVEYSGIIDHPLEQVGEEYARGQRRTAGRIGSEGIYLSGSSAWYPQFEGDLFTFSLTVEVPSDWSAVSQGSRSLQEIREGATFVSWKSTLPQDDIILVAGPYIEYTRESDALLSMVFLRQADEALAGRYLDATEQYVRMYSSFLGQYPYDKFALVENFWETGYGMPSFTLLGPKVIRFPFILHSSYPHEILHNWWGNSVFIDYESGNWGEGLTAYLSDHLIKEQRGGGAEHRRTVLQKYTDYVSSGRDLPLSEFRSRHGSVSEAVGYGKTLMLFHMLRRSIGDDLFRRCLQDFYRDHRFQTASFDDLRRSFEKSSGRSLRSFFDQWVLRPGAPELSIAGAEFTIDSGRYLLALSLRQVQDGESLFSIDVPISVTLEGRDEAFVTTVPLQTRSGTFEIPLPAPPLRIDVDPEFDLFRRLDRSEIPPALSQAFGSDKALILLPSGLSGPLADGYGELAALLGRTGPGEIALEHDDSLEDLPSDRSVWLIGWENLFFPEFLRSLGGYDASFSGETVRLERTELPRQGHVFAAVVRHPLNDDLALLWIGGDNPSAMPGLGRKLPHYHKYSYLAFEGDEPANVAKGRWPVMDSPLTFLLPGTGGEKPEPVDRGRLPDRPPLAELKPLFSGDRMLETIRFLTGDELEGRGLGTPGLDRAAAYIAESFAASGLLPAGDGGKDFFQEWTHRGEGFPAGIPMKNVVAMIPGTRAEWSGQSVVIGAHYDHLGRGEGPFSGEVRKDSEGLIHPGADDNASGVAVLLELARLLGGEWKPERTVYFVAFTGEEAGKLGARRFVEHHSRFPADACRAMLNLDTVGRLSGGKIMVLGGDSAKEWVHIFRGAGYLSGVEVEMVSGDLDSSDHVCFQEKGVPAVQLFTGPHLDYHRPGDRAEKIDVDGLVKVANLTKETLEYLAGRVEPLSSQPSAAVSGSPERPPPGRGKRSSLGTVPDFSFGGDGVRLTGVVPASPAAKADLREGDVIIRVGGTAVHSLGDLSDVLKSFEAGTTVEVIFIRAGENQRVEVLLEER